MVFCPHGGEQSASTAKSLIPSFLIKLLVFPVDLVEESGVTDMQLIWCNSDNGPFRARQPYATNVSIEIMSDLPTILIVEIRDLLRVLAFEHNLVVRLIPAGDGGKPGTRKAG